MDSDNSIAIVGIGCIFPGANNIEEFWGVLENGEDHVQDIPRDRFNIDAYYDPDPDHPSKTYVRKAGLVQSYDRWDNRFFGISDKEAERVDPQQFMVLETVHMALEDAGITKAELDKSNTGVYIGAMNNDWRCVLRASGEDSTNSTVTGVDVSIISARVAYHYNLTGPAMTIETACSSSMVAIHTASQALMSGDISMAICGGVNCIIDPGVFVILSSARMASRTGKCHTFSDDADGYARGEGCGIVILKRLVDAKKDNNKIWGTVKTAVNQDGHMNTPITAPSGVQQVELMEKLYQAAGVSPERVQYIEAHGTGTQIGDLVEVTSLGRFFSKENNIRTKIGSVKTNIGHLESAAGVAGLIKILLMMRHGKYVPSLHASHLNSKIPFHNYKFSVSQNISDWALVGEQGRLACINCFGFGGTNSHAIVQQIVKFEKTENEINNWKSCLSKKSSVIISSNDKESLKQSALTMQSVLSKKTFQLCDISSTSVFHRNIYRFRKVFFAESSEDLQSQLHSFCQDKNTSQIPQASNPDIAFVYCGVGTTWQTMCQDMLRLDKTFRETISQIDFHLQSLTDIRVFSVLRDGEDLSDPLKNHLCLFACQIGLTESLKSIGIRPSAVLGQSVGEVAAAYTSGSLTLLQAVYVIYHRSFFLSKFAAGTMVVVRNVTTNNVDEECKRLKTGTANIAVYHSNVSCAVSGSNEAIEELSRNLTEKGAQVIPLDVKCAYHSPLVKRASECLKMALDGLQVNKPFIKIFSCITGKESLNKTFASSHYWQENVLKPVLFQQTIKNMRKTFSNLIFLEIGPHPVLMAHISNLFPDSREICISTMRKNMGIKPYFEAFSELFQHGINPVWKIIVPRSNTILSVPKYHFKRRKCYISSEKLSIISEGIDSVVQYKMVKLLPGTDCDFVVHINKRNTLFVYEHLVDGNVIVPGALYGEIGFEISKTMKLKHPDISWSIKKPLVIKTESQEIYISITNVNNGTVIFEAFCDSLLLASGIIRENSHQLPKQLNIERLVILLDTKNSSTSLYEKLREMGFQHGPLFQTIVKNITNETEVISMVNLSAALLKDSDRTSLHPVIIDTMFQSCMNFESTQHRDRYTRLFPVHVRSLRLFQNPQQKMICYTQSVIVRPTKIVFNILLLSLGGSIIAEINGFEIAIINAPDDIQNISFIENWQEISVDNVQMGFNKEITILSWNKSIVNTFEHIINKENEGMVVSSILVDESMCVEDFRVRFQEHEHSNLIFVPCLQSLDDTFSGKDLLRQVTTYCHIFLELLKILYKNDVHVSVVTHNTQFLKDTDVVSVFGSELWGMARSASQEGTSISFCLVDFHGQFNANVHLILQVIAMSQKLPGNSIPYEFAIQNNTVYRNQLDKMDIFNDQSLISLDESRSSTTALSIRVEEQSNKRTYFAIPCISEKTFDGKKHIIRPELALTFPAQHQPSNANCILPEEYWSHHGYNGETIRVLEATGKAVIGNDEVDVVVCCRENLATHMAIEKPCVSLKSDIPNYIIGDIFYVTQAIYIANLIERNSVVYVNFDVDSKDVVNFLSPLLGEKKCQLKFFHRISTAVISMQATHVVVLVKRSFTEAAEVKLLFPRATTIIVTKGWIPNYSKRTLDGIEKIFVLKYENIFKHEKFSSIMQKAKIALCRTCRNILKSRNTNNEGPHHRNVLNVTEMLKNLKMKISTDFPIRKDAAYIVVGGLSGLGWLIVKFLARMGAKLVITLSRRCLPDEITHRIENVKRLHKVDIVHIEADITSHCQVLNAVKNIQQQYPKVPIKGIFQGAGILRDNVIPKMTVEDFDEPLGVKILGTWNLHLATKDLGLDIFLMHSSIASTFGNYAQANYAAANSFIDCFSFYRRSMGLCAQTVNWGALAVGMAADPTLYDILSYKGIHLINKQQIYNALNQALIMNFPQSIFASFDLRKFISRISKRWSDSKFMKMMSHLDVMESIPKDIPSLDYPDTNSNLTEVVKGVSSAVLMIDKSEIDEDSSLLKFGLDSQNAVEIINLLHSETAFRIPIFLLLSGEYSVRELAGFIDEKKALVDEGVLLENIEDFAKKPSFIEKHYLQLHEENIVKDGINVVFEYEISIEANKPELWKSVIFYMYWFHPELRIKYNISGNNQKWKNVVKEVIDIEDVMLDFSVFPFTASSDKMDRILMKRDMHMDIPMKAIYFAGHSYSILRLICNRLFFDDTCGKIIFNQMQTIAAYLIARKTIPSCLYYNHIDTSVVIKRCLQPSVERLEHFWTAQIKSSMISSLDVLSINQRDDTDNEAVFHYCDTRLVQKLKVFLQKESQWTLFNIICSAYQVVLQRLTHSENVLIMTAFDLREKIPDLQDRIVSCENELPLISPPLAKNNLTFTDLLEKNRETINEARTNSLFPIDRCKFPETFKSREHFLHFLRVFVHEEHDINGPCLHYCKIKTERYSSYKTQLCVRYKRKSAELQLELQFCPRFANQCIAENITEHIETVLEMMVKNKEDFIESWIPLCKLYLDIKKHAKGVFMLYKNLGKHERVTLEYKEKPVALLQWGFGSRRMIFLTDIVAVKPLQLHGYSAMQIEVSVQSRGETIFMSKHRRLRDAWISFISDALSTKFNRT